MPTLTLQDHVVEYQQSGAGPDLLLVHSLLTDMSVFDRVAPDLAARHRITRVNLPGYGASSARPFESLEAYADHLAGVMDALQLPRSTMVFGNGFGAFVSLVLAIRHGSRLDCLIAADALAVFPEPARVPFRVMSQKVTAGGMAAVLDAAIGRMFPPAFSAANPDEVARRKAALAAVDAPAFSRACLALSVMDLTASLSRIRNPTTILCGALDQTTPPDLARKLAQGIPGARYREIAGAGHCPMIEQPGATVNEILHAIIDC